MSMPVLLGCTLLLSTTLVATAFSTLPAPSTRSDDRALEAMVATEIQTRLLSRTLHALYEAEEDDNSLNNIHDEELEEEEEENTAFDEQDEDIPEVTLEEMEESFLDAENNLDASREEGFAHSADAFRDDVDALETMGDFDEFE